MADFIMGKNIRENRILRESFMELAIKTFGLSFESWYQNGYWTDKYIPYAMTDGEKVVANASVNIIDTVWENQSKRYIQIGTVMTDDTYRNRGLARCVLEEIQKDWKNSCDAIYLFANDTVLDFYPKFGFVKVLEYQCTLPVIPKAGNVKKLDMSKEKDRNFLKRYYGKSNPFSALPMLNNYELLMFYCSDFMKDCVFYCEEMDAVAVVMKDDDTFTCMDIFCGAQKSLTDVLSAIADRETRHVTLGFTPKDKSDCTVTAIEDENTTLFVLKDKENIFAQNKVMFPILSHA